MTNAMRFGIRGNGPLDFVFSETMLGVGTLCREHDIVRSVTISCYGVIAGTSKVYWSFRTLVQAVEFQKYPKCDSDCDCKEAQNMSTSNFGKRCKD
jgi:hypothetical protein